MQANIRHRHIKRKVFEIYNMRLRYVQTISESFLNRDIQVFVDNKIFELVYARYVKYVFMYAKSFVTSKFLNFSFIYV